MALLMKQQRVFFLVLAIVACLTCSTTVYAVSIDPVTTPTNVNGQTVTGALDEGETAVSVTCSTNATIGTVTYDTPTAWRVEITGLTEGENIITATGNPGSASIDKIILLDTKPPVLSISALADGTYTNNQALNISGIVTDTASGVKNLTINNTPVALGADGSFSNALQLSSGVNEVTTVAIDNAGNETSDTRTINLDQTAPTITITAPADNSATSHSTIDVTGTADEKISSVAITVNNDPPQTFSEDGTAFAATVNLTMGQNTILVTAADLASNPSTQAKRTVTYDNTQPSLQVTDPPQDITTRQNSVTVKGKVSDSYSAVVVTITMDNETFTPEMADDGTFEQTVTFTADKTYQVIVTATNAAGTSTSVQRNIIHDTSAPAVTSATTSTASGFYRAGTVIPITVNFSKTISTDQLSIALNTNPVVSISTGSLSGVSSFTINYIVADGDNSASLGITSITGSIIDVAGNSTSALAIPAGQNIDSGKTIVVDTTPPAVTITAQPFDPSNEKTGSFSFTADEPGSTECKLDDGSYSTCSSGFRFDFSTAVDGRHTFSVRANDPAGNTGFETSYSWTIDTISPDTLITSHPAPFSSTAAESFGFNSSDPTAVFECRVDNTPYAPCSSPYDFASLPDGSHLFRVRSRDLAGNVDPSPANFTWTIDTVPPSVNAGGNQIRNGIFTPTATATDATGLTCQWTRQSGPGTITFGSPTEVATTVSAGVDGSYVIRLTATDAAGNIAYSDMNMVWDTTPPSVTTGNQVRNGTYTQTATINDATAVTCQWTRLSGPGTITFGTSTEAATTITAGVDGTYAIRLTATDAAGNTAYSDMTLVWDTVLPSVNAGGNRAGNARFTQTATAGDTLSMTYAWSSTSGPGNVTFGSPNALSTTISADTDGIYTLRFSATDAAGNSAFSEMTLAWDVVPPELAISTLPNNSYTNEPVLNISGTVKDPVSGVLRFSINGVDVPFDSNGEFSYAATLDLGANVITIVSLDFAGNSSSEVRTITFDPAAPTLTITSPAGDLKTNSSAVTVTGTVDKQCKVAITVTGSGSSQSFPDVPVTGNIFTLPLTGLTTGRNTIDITATSNALKQSTKTVVVTYDNQKPLLEVTEPGQDTRNPGSLVIKGRVTDSQTDVTVTITTESERLTPAIVNGEFQQVINFSKENIYLVVVKAADEAGNEAVVERKTIFAKPNGDVNGDGRVDTSDALLALQISVGLEPRLDNDLIKGDVGPLLNGKPAPDWKIDISDVVVILRIIVKKVILP